MDPLSGPDSARQFLAWLRSTGRAGEWSDKELSDLYLEHCAAERLTPTADATVRRFLKDLGGVEKVMQEAGKVGNRRKRATIWKIAPALRDTRAVQEWRAAA